jgi:hypothetical protein
MKVPKRKPAAVGLCEVRTLFCARAKYHALEIVDARACASYREPREIEVEYSPAPLLSIPVPQAV